MKKHRWFAVISAMVMAFAGCQINSDNHEHSFSKDWTSDATDHWHAATCEHTKEVSDKAAHTFGEWKTSVEATEEAEGKKERVCSVCSYKEETNIAKLGHTHKFSENWTSDSIYHWHVAICGHAEEVSDKAAHTFGEWKTSVEATEEAEGKKERVCSVCSYKEETNIAKLGHTHKFSENWTSDSIYHWHVAICGHAEEVSDKAAHTFGDYVSNNDATTESDGTKTRKCSVCGYEDTVTDEGSKIVATPIFSIESGAVDSGTSVTITCSTEGAKVYYTTDGTEPTAESTEYADAISVTEAVTLKAIAVKSGMNNSAVASVSYTIIPEGFVKVKGTTITGSESWTPSSSVFVSGRSITIPDMYVCDHEVTRGEFKEVMGTDPSTASAYDKDGNKLTGDAVLNNPVNYVNWYAAIAYCNKLSLKENLTPCYSVSGVTDWENLAYSSIPTSSNSTWDALTYDKEADGYRLPTEAEWEWLARGGENYTYAGSNTVDDVAWYIYNNTNATGSREVKTKQANGYGLYDMSGNVYEWCYDWYNYTVNSSTADTGASSGPLRVQRGGCWCVNDDFCRVYDRYCDCPDYRSDPDYRLGIYGFRVVRSSSK